MKNISRRNIILLLKWIPVAGATCFLLFYLCILIIPSFYPFPIAELESRKPTSFYLDKDGNLLMAQTGWKDCWQIPVRLDEVSPYLIDATIATEDKRFYKHNGVDWLAAASRTMQNFMSMRIVAGGSTLTMQLARLAAPPEKRSFSRKWKQVWRAYNLERSHSKKWILEQYLNHAPYGGNIVGVEAAARLYFGKSASELNKSEATLLAGLPQSPSYLRPDRYPEKAWKRQKTVIASVKAANKPTPDPDAAHQTVLNAHLRSSTLPEVENINKLGLPFKEEQFCFSVPETDHNKYIYHTTLDYELQQNVRKILKQHVDKYAGISNGAAVVIEVKTGAVVSMVGTINKDALPSGEVNVATSKRSPGSTLKPFLYLLAVQNGLITTETVVDGGALTGSNYVPHNFDGKYYDNISAEIALQNSLNTPAVRLLKGIGVRNMISNLKDMGITTLTRKPEKYGLSLILGGCEVELLELVNAYATLSRDGVYMPCKLTNYNNETLKQELFNPGAITIVNQMLSRPLPSANDMKIAWKTGTSNGYRDSWCIGYNNEYAVGVWLGNNDGKSSLNLIGSKSAAPVIADLFAYLYTNRPIPEFPADKSQQYLRNTFICAKTGLKATQNCKETKASSIPGGIALKQCNNSCVDFISTTAKQIPNSLEIISPTPGTYVSNNGTLKVNLKLKQQQPCYWFHNGTPVPVNNNTLNLKPGRHTISACSEDGMASDKTTVTVE